VLILSGWRPKLEGRLMTEAGRTRRTGVRMAAHDDESTYEVGFGKPPTQSRFKKGASGNPNGRPKGKRNLVTVLERTLRETIVIEENGMRRTVTKLEAAVKQLVNKAAAGDLIALRHLTALAKSADSQTVDAPTGQSEDADLKVLQGVLKRLKDCAAGDENEI